MNKLSAIIYHVSRLALAVTFLYAGYIKGADPVAFAGQVANYQILPYAWNFLVAATLPYLEFFCGALLLLNQRVRPAVLVLFVLNLIFIVLLSYTIARGLDIDCGCFNPNGESKTEPLHALWRDVGLLVLMIFTWLLRYRQPLPEDRED